MKKLLIVDDDIDMCLLLHIFLTRKGYKVNEAYTCGQAWEYLQYNQPDLVICDVWLEDMDGITFLKKVKDTFAEIPFIFITAYDDIKTSVNAIKCGALEYVTKPLLPQEIAAIVQRSLDKVSANKKKPFHGEIVATGMPDLLYGETEWLRRLSKQVNLVAPTNCSVMIHGENGTGKKTIAKQIHLGSPRRNKAFVEFNCRAYPGDAAETALFGYDLHHAGGKKNTSTGYLQASNGGTLLLDEVAELPYKTQLHLIKAIKEKKIPGTIGSDETELDIRLLASSTINLWHAAHNGKLAEEMYHLLNDFTIDVLPLRSRTDDIMLFAHHFLKTANTEMGKRIIGFSPEVEILFKNHVWTDNLRELKNVIKKAVVLNESPVIEACSLPVEIRPISKSIPFVPRQQLGVLG